MQLEHYSVEQLKREVYAIFARYIDLSVYRVFFFGSRVSGNNTVRSDIDIGIEGPEPIPLKAKSEIEDAIEDLSILYKIEIVDFTRVSEKFKEVALQHTEPIIV
ncbi:MAG: nucleotidyltransferase domain-containing protein [bacterium]|nr:nucleotidyltransferase domain-containing protein [bacterium]